MRRWFPWIVLPILLVVAIPAYAIGGTAAVFVVALVVALGLIRWHQTRA